ncbi:bacillithiol biosynthesis cysteine-adding enzyme BshC [Pedobacter aquae]|uniref:Putative cysteine ligase BshC n=1 Tax=Pedobacter aquae TaxID=2605747 RepID=A0A5C0VI32_9SPHI|nr:bacillithiol biosynthesis cysteine-adding enzyme BshC [Pedobacter aquae]QEK51747.1 bacillithiol biosynthesis cysteine-adding enzyme BshC [Pedobacter aquae]
MEAQYIDYEETRCFSPALIRYIRQDADLKPFYHHPANLAGFKALLANKKVIANRQALVEVLKEQYQAITNQSAVTQTHINQLLQDNSYTITTGHQLNIFTGPLYFIFKIVTAINLAKDLKKEFPHQNFIPVYWMASEDHDFEEINHTYIGGKKIAWKKETAGATGKVDTKSIIQALNEYKGILGLSDNALQLSKMVDEAYTKFAKLADATRYLVNEIFGEHGLVIIDADHPQLKKQFVPIIKQDITKQHSFKNISDTDKALTDIGITPQVNAREINFFYLTDDLRERIIYEGQQYQVLNTAIKFSEDELKQEIENNPERFSPNVVMRPLYQEVILPNIAYIGGGAEVIYWLQLKLNFDFYKVDFPILILRNSAMIANTKLKDKLNRLKLDFKDIFEDIDTLKSRWIKAHSNHILDLKNEWRELECIFERLKLRAHKIDPTLSPSTEAVKVRLEKAILNLEKKLLKAEKKNFADAMSNLDKIKYALFPGGGLQERKENFGLFYVAQGDDFIQNLIQHFIPLDFKFTILI